MSRPLKHTSLKKLSAHIKTKPSNDRTDGSLTRKCISQEKDNLNITSPKNHVDHKQKKPMSKLRIRTDFE